MGREKKYNAKSLREAVEKYFSSISRDVTVKEKVDSGKKDSYGHVIYDLVPVKNKLGQEVITTEYIVPPTVGGLCQFLGIHRSTWTEYCDAELHPEFSDTTTRAQGRLRDYREEQLLTRSGKDLKGVIFDLENNYGYRERKDVNLSGGTVEDFLQQLSECGKGAQEF